MSELGDRSGSEVQIRPEPKPLLRSRSEDERPAYTTVSETILQQVLQAEMSFPWEIIYIFLFKKNNKILSVTCPTCINLFTWEGSGGGTYRSHRYHTPSALYPEEDS